MPQTRFVLKKSLELGLKPMVVINKIDKPAADPAECEVAVLELFLELGASDEQADFPIVYAIGREGIAKRNLEDDSKDLTPLLDAILEYVPSATNKENAALPLRLQPFNLAYDNFLGRMAIARIYDGTVHSGDTVYIGKPGSEQRAGKITKLFTFSGLTRTEVKEAYAGDIALLAGMPDIEIGETISAQQDVEMLPTIDVDDPTISLSFLVNNSPFSGREGKYVTTRQIHDYLKRELEVNVGLRVDFSPSDYFMVSGRGSLHIAILIENMRRAGYELQVSQPQVIFHEENGKKTEPFEKVIVDVPSQYQGVVIERLGKRGMVMTGMEDNGPTVRLTFEGPTRGLLGYRTQFVIDTKGDGILSSRVIGFKPYAGMIGSRSVGSMISMMTGKALGYSLWGLQERGVLYISPATEVYEGQVIGNTSKGEDMAVNPTKNKNLTNIRSSGTDEAITLIPPYELTIERGLEIMSGDEYLEITPKSIRLRKKFLTDSDRAKARRAPQTKK